MSANYSADLDRLIAAAYDTGARMAVMQAHSLLCMRGHQDAAEALLTHYESIVARANTYPAAQHAINRAKEAA